MPQLPNQPDYLRVKLRRRLARLGAVAVRGSVYALPYTADAVEDFAWLRREIVAEGGDAIICAAKLLDGMTNEAMAELFRRDCDARYAALTDEATRAARADRRDAVPRLRRKLETIARIDYFNAEGGAAAEAALRAFDVPAYEGTEMMGSANTAHTIGAGNTWVTRAGPKIDRIGSAWLILRFLDSAARFRFVDPQSYQHQPGELRFDMFEGEFTHEGERCTFETLIAAFGLRDSALDALAEMVHDIDVKDAKYGRPETPGLASLVNGIVATQPVDEDRLERGFVVFDSLYESLRLGR